MKRSTLGGFGYGSPPSDVFSHTNPVGVRSVGGIGTGVLGNEISFSSSDLSNGKKAKLRLVGKIVTASGIAGGTLNFSVSPITLPSTTLGPGFIFLDVEFVSIGYQLAGSSISPDSIYPGVSETHYVGTYIGGDGISQAITGKISGGPNNIEVDISLSSVTGPDQAWFVLGELSFKIEE